MYKFRLRFSKQDSLRFIGHLDFLRIFQQMIRRSRLPIAYSQGFNPHQQLSFALPLPLGMSSINDYADISLIEELATEKIVSALGAVAPNGLYIHEATSVKPGEGAAAAIVDTALYSVCISNMASVDPAKIEEVLVAKNLTVLKKTKSGIKNTDIRADIKNIEIRDTTIEMLLSAGSSHFLNPLLVAEVIFGEKPCTSTITRAELYKGDGKPL